MKIKILIKDTIKNTVDVLPLLKKSKFLDESHELIEYYNDKNWHEVFTKAYKDFTKGKFHRFIIFDDYGYGPFLFISKQKGLVATSAFDEYSANLIRAHNNSKVCIIPVKRIDTDRISNIITAFCVSNFDAGRHVTRLQIIHGAFKPTDKPLEFAKVANKVVVIGSDHAGFALKEAVKEHLTNKGYKVIDVGTHSLDSTHYSMYGVAIAKHIPEASYAIGICWTGMGMCNALNKFKGIRACICMTPENAKIARETYGANTLVMGSKFSTKDEALATVDTYLNTPAKQNPVYQVIDNYGCEFDYSKFTEIKIEKGIVIPPELQ